MIRGRTENPYYTKSSLPPQKTMNTNVKMSVATHNVNHYHNCQIQYGKKDYTLVNIAI